MNGPMDVSCLSDTVVDLSNKKIKQLHEGNLTALS